MPDFRSVYGGSQALIVGINSYADPRFVTLGYAEQDARAVASLLSGPPYSFATTTLLGEQATKAAIQDALFSLRQTQPDDRILFYFAGHGYVLTDRLGSETGYLAAADTIPERDFTAIEINEVTSLTRYAPAKHIGFIFDACFSGQALGLTRAPSVAANKYLERRAYQVISAGAGDQTVADYRSMTGTMISALESGVLVRDGMVTLSELGLYVRDSIAADSNRTQIPQFGHLRGSAGGEFVFSIDTRTRLPADLEEALRSARSNARLGAVIDLIELAYGGEAEIATLARERLAQSRDGDPDERVREAAASYFEEIEARRLAEEARQRAERARQAREIRRERQQEQMEVPAETPRPDETTPAPVRVRPSEFAEPDEDAAALAASEPPFEDSYSPPPVQVAPRRARARSQTRLLLIAGGIGALAITGVVIGLVALLGPRGGQGSETPVGEATQPPAPSSAPALQATEDRDNSGPGGGNSSSGGGSGGSDNSGPGSGSSDPGVLTWVSDQEGNDDIFNDTLDNLTDHPARDLSPAWSPDGRRLAFSSDRDGDFDLYVMDADGSNLSQLTNEPSNELSPDWSPDGSRIAFNCIREDAPQICIINTDGSNLTVLTQGNIYYNSPDWSPDGSRIVFSANLTVGNFLIAVMDADGTDINLLTETGETTSPAWSPDGEQIAFAYRVNAGVPPEIYVMDPDGSNLIQLTDLGVDSGSPAWSADGSQIAFRTDVDGNNDIYVMNADGSGLTRLTSSDASDVSPAWRPAPQSGGAPAQEQTAQADEAFALATEGVTANRDWQPYTEEFDGALMALVPKGCFMMGSDQLAEWPVHRVCLSAPYWIDVYEVTNQQYGGASSGTSCTPSASGDNQPRVCVTWAEANAHCTARRAHLPTEAQWEYALRGPSSTAYPWGDTFDGSNVVYDTTQSADVGSMPGGESWVGALDMLGNVWEWVADWYDRYPRSGADEVDPQGASAMTYRVLRGGAWSSVSVAQHLRSTARSTGQPAASLNDVGFRCARSF